MFVVATIAILVTLVLALLRAVLGNRCGSGGVQAAFGLRSSDDREHIIVSIVALRLALLFVL